MVMDFHTNTHPYLQAHGMSLLNCTGGIEMSEPINFKDRIPKLSEQHIKQICRFANTEYVEGEWRRWRAWAEFKKWHHKILQEQDELRRKIGEIEMRSKNYPPVQSVLNEYISLKDKLAKLKRGEY